MDVGKDTALSDGNVAQKLVQLLIVADGELKVARNDTGLLVVTSGIASQFKNFGGEILKDSSEVYGSTSTDTLGIVALAEQAVHTTDGERETGLRRAAVDYVSMLFKTRQDATDPSWNARTVWDPRWEDSQTSRTARRR